MNLSMKNFKTKLVVLLIGIQISYYSAAVVNSSSLILGKEALWKKVGSSKNAIKPLFDIELENESYSFFEIQIKNAKGEIQNSQVSITKLINKGSDLKVIFSDVSIWGLNDFDDIPGLENVKVRQALEVAYAKHLKGEYKLKGKSWKSYAQSQLDSETSDAAKWVFKQISLEE